VHAFSVLDQPEYEISFAKREWMDLSAVVSSQLLLTRVNSTNVLNEGLMIGEIGRRMNSKVKLIEIGVCRK
jgi:hypothetical protein